MAENGADWASRFEQANREIVAAVEGLSDDQWAAMVPGEDWTVGVVVHHLGYGTRSSRSGSKCSRGAKRFW